MRNYRRKFLNESPESPEMMDKKDIDRLNSIVSLVDELKETRYKKGYYEDSDRRDYFPILVDLISLAARVLNDFEYYDRNSNIREYTMFGISSKQLEEAITKIEEVLEHR